VPKVGSKFPAPGAMSALWALSRLLNKAYAIANALMQFQLCAELTWRKTQLLLHTKDISKSIRCAQLALAKRANADSQDALAYCLPSRNLPALWLRLSFEKSARRQDPTPACKKTDWESSDFRRTFNGEYE
jgi:hypothetical protein